MTDKESKYNEECKADCVVHKLATHNTCVFCSSCRNSPYYRESFFGKSDEGIEAIRKEVSEEFWYDIWRRDEKKYRRISW